MSIKQPRRRHVPQRTCVVCRQTKNKRELTRIVSTDSGDLLVDRSGKLAGRGAYLCSQTSCWDTAISGSVLKKALRLNVQPEALKKLAEQRPAAEIGNAL